MEELSKLEHLSLVSKICTELDNNLGINDKDLAEFIIDLAEKNTTFESFKQALIENGASEFPDSFIRNLLRIIQLMKTSKSVDTIGVNTTSNPKTERLAEKFPGLALANCPQASTDSDDEKNESDKKGKSDKKKNIKKIERSVADDMMAELEALAPSTKDNPDEKDSKIKKRERSRSRDRHRRRSRSRDRKRSRSRERKRSRSRDRKRSRSRDRQKRSRSKDRARRRSRSRDKHRQKDRNRSRSHSPNRSRRNRSPPPRKRSATPMTDDPVAGKIYSGRVANIVSFGCFVQLLGVKKRWEGLVHISQLRAEGRVDDVTEVVSRGQMVKVKVVSIAGQKVSLSMKEVDQETGADLNPASHSHLNDEARDRNPDRPSGSSSFLDLDGAHDHDDEEVARKKVTRISSPERWEIKQMISSGVIDRTEMPDFDEETGLLPKDEDNEADIEIEIVEEEPAFLRGHGRALHDLSPVRIVKNPDGSLAQAAMMQSALSKERREIQMLQREQEMEGIPSSLNKNWIDPLPQGMYCCLFYAFKS